MSTLISPTAEPVLLDGVSWATYTCLLKDFGDSHAARLAYDQGRLEIMAPSFAHEQLKHLLALLVEVLAYELGVDLLGAGSTTLKREDVARGFEPDASFYSQHAAAIRGKMTIDLAIDPPPDLVIEIDITHPSLDKLPIYAAIGVSEVWRYDGQQVFVHRLEGNRYRQAETSTVLPGVATGQIAQFLSTGQHMSRAAWFATIQTWART